MRNDDDLELIFPENKIQATYVTIGIQSIKYLEEISDMVENYKYRANFERSLYDEEQNAINWLNDLINKIKTRKQERIDKNKENGFVD